MSVLRNPPDGISSDFSSTTYYGDRRGITSPPFTQILHDKQLADLMSYAKDITSLEQIIDPYEYAKQYLSDDSAEGRAKYLHYLEQGKYIQQMQMTAYENWYNSPEQQALRQREAGLNPDLNGVENAASASGAAPDGSGVAGLPTEEQLTAQKIQNITSIVNSIAGVANLASSFANLSLIKPQKELMQSQALQGQLNNIATAEGLYSKGIAGRLASAISSAGDAFDAASWFDDDSNFDGLFAAMTPNPSPQMEAIFNNLRTYGRESLMSQALDINKQRAQTQSDFADIVSDPRYSDDVVIQVAQTRPLMKALFEIRQLKADFEQERYRITKEYMDNLDPAALAEYQNAFASAGTAEAGYNYDYFSELNGKVMAGYEKMIKSCENVRKTMEKSIYENLKTIYDLNPNSQRGIASSYLLLHGTSMQWYEYLGASISAYGLDIDGYGSRQMPDIPDSRYSEIQDKLKPADQWLQENMENGWFID